MMASDLDVFTLFFNFDFINEKKAFFLGIRVLVDHFRNQSTDSSSLRGWISCSAVFLLLNQQRRCCEIPLF